MFAGRLLGDFLVHRRGAGLESLFLHLNIALSGCWSWNIYFRKGQIRAGKSLCPCWHHWIPECDPRAPTLPSDFILRDCELPLCLSPLEEGVPLYSQHKADILIW